MSKSGDGVYLWLVRLCRAAVTAPGTSYPKYTHWSAAHHWSQAACLIKLGQGKRMVTHIGNSSHESYLDKAARKGYGQFPPFCRPDIRRQRWRERIYVLSSDVYSRPSCRSWTLCRSSADSISAWRIAHWSWPDLSTDGMEMYDHQAKRVLGC